jgi:hypothetical protein
MATALDTQGFDEALEPVVGDRISMTKTQTSNWARGVTIRNLSILLVAMVVGTSPHRK